MSSAEAFDGCRERRPVAAGEVVAPEGSAGKDGVPPGEEDLRRFGVEADPARRMPGGVWMTRRFPIRSPSARTVSGGTIPGERPPKTIERLRASSVRPGRVRLVDADGRIAAEPRDLLHVGDMVVVGVGDDDRIDRGGIGLHHHRENARVDKDVFVNERIGVGRIARDPPDWHAD